MIDTVENISVLIAYPTPTNGQIVYVKGYYAPGDGGEGMFMYDASSSKMENYGTTFTPSFGDGRWERQYSGFLKVQFFGVKEGWIDPGSTFSNSDRIQNMVDYANEYTDNNPYSDMTIFFPNGTYYIDKTIIIKSRVKFFGSPGTFLANNQESKFYDFMFEIANGPVTMVRFENFFINLNHRPNVGAFRLKAKFSNPDEPDALGGGIWNANFKNIEVLNCDGTSILMQGGEITVGSQGVNEQALVNQFIIFENVRGRRWDAKYTALEITGLTANVTFLNCEFLTQPPGEGETSIGGTCIYIGSRNSHDPEQPYRLGSDAISFINSGFGGYSEYGAVIEDARNITFDTCFIEGVDYAFVTLRAIEISVLRSKFANAAGMGSRIEYSHTQGYGSIFLTRDSLLNIEANHVTVSRVDYREIEVQKFIDDDGNNNNVLNVRNNDFIAPQLGMTTGIMQVVAPTANRIEIWSKKLVYINVPVTTPETTWDITIVDSSLNAGESVFFRANGGRVRFLPMPGIVPMPSSDNLNLNGLGSLILANGQAAIFTVIDNAGGNIPPTYQLTSFAF